LFKAADGKIDLFRADEDIGGQTAMLINPVMWRKWYKPGWARVNEFAHAKGAKIWLHSCGYCRDVVPDFIDMGADVLDPVPPYVRGSDPGDMKKQFGSRLCLQGGVNHIDALIYGNPEKVKNEVKLRMDEMKNGGGYICGPSQVFTDQMPIDNIISLFDAAFVYGQY